MTFEEYQAGVAATWNHSPEIRDQIVNAALGVAGEAGEFADLIKKIRFHGVPQDDDKIVKELGDVLYYVTVSAAIHGYSLEEIADKNNKKLAARYPEGFVKGGGNR